MSRKYNTKHPDRGTSKYPERLRSRGLSKTPEMEDLEDLAKRQGRRIRETCSLDHDHDLKSRDCDGHPYWISGISPADDETLSAA